MKKVWKIKNFYYLYIMNITQFQAEAEYLIEKLEDLVQKNMPQKGDTTETCQRMCIQQAINELSYTFNGTEQKDLEEDEED